MMLITTRYVKPRGSRGARIVARSVEGSCSIPYPYNLDGRESRLAAANALLKKLGKNSRLIVCDTVCHGFHFLAVDGDLGLGRVLACSREVVANWSNKDLATWVRELDMALADFDSINPPTK